MKTAIEKKLDTIMDMSTHAILSANTCEEVQTECDNGVRHLRDLRFLPEVLAMPMDDYNRLSARIDMSIDCLKSCRWTWAVAKLGKEER